MKKRKILWSLLLSLVFILAIGVVGASAESVTLNPNDKDSAVVLSNGNLTISRNTSVFSYARSNATITGKKYFEVKIDSESYTAAVGISNNTAMLNSGADWPTDNYQTYVETINNRIMVGHSTQLGAFSSAGTGDIIMVAVDEPNRKVYFGINGTWVNNVNPVSNNGYNITWTGDIYAYLGGYESGDKLTANFGATAFKYDPPVGYPPIDQPNLPNAPTSLTATPGDTKVTLSWPVVTGAKSYKVYYGTTSGTYGDPVIVDAPIDGSTTVSKTIENLSNGTLYYFAVTAVTPSGESPKSLEKTATPTAGTTPPPATGNGTLIVTVANNADREYNLTMAQIQAFIDWYNNRSTGGNVYTIEKTATAPYTKIKDYLIFDKIVAWQVKEY